jgi:transcriptional regulator of arginine metabolism
MKRDRQSYMLELTETKEVETQEQMLKLLLEAGFPATQATVSRDINALGLVKRPGSAGHSRYAHADDGKLARETEHRNLALVSAALQGAEVAGHMVCLHCGIGLAQGVCAVLDSLHWDGMVGSIAGDDTIFVLCRSAESAKEYKEKVHEYAARAGD